MNFLQKMMSKLFGKKTVVAVPSVQPKSTAKVTELPIAKQITIVMEELRKKNLTDMKPYLEGFDANVLAGVYQRYMTIARLEYRADDEMSAKQLVTAIIESRVIALTKWATDNQKPITLTEGQIRLYNNVAEKMQSVGLPMFALMQNKYEFAIAIDEAITTLKDHGLWDNNEISDKQRSRLFALAIQAGVDGRTVLETVTKDNYQSVCDNLIVGIEKRKTIEPTEAQIQRIKKLRKILNDKSRKMPANIVDASTLINQLYKDVKETCPDALAASQSQIDAIEYLTSRLGLETEIKEGITKIEASRLISGLRRKLALAYCEIQGYSEDQVKKMTDEEISGLLLNIQAAKA